MKRTFLTLVSMALFCVMLLTTACSNVDNIEKSTQSADAILNFTIIGLKPDTEVSLLLKEVGDGAFRIIDRGKATTDWLGTATFTMSADGGLNLKDLALSVDGDDIELSCTSKILEAGKTYDITKNVDPTKNVVYLSKLTGNYEAKNGDILTGTLTGSTQDYKISIAPGASVTLANATINGVNATYCTWAGLNCPGDATIVLMEGTINTVIGFFEDYPGIHIAVDKTLTIKGSGTLHARPNRTFGYAAGIGGGVFVPCGNIEILGGTITATGEGWSAGIGGGQEANCGNITIAGVGTCVTATKGIAAPYSIGAGYNGTCGTVTIAGVVTGSIAKSPYTVKIQDMN